MHLTQRFRIGRRSLLVILAVVATVVTGVLVGQQADASQAPKYTVVQLLPVGEARVGDSITLKLITTDADNLAGFQSRVLFDDMALRPVGARIEGGLTAGGRSIISLGPVIRDGAIDLGAATCALPDCQTPTTERAGAQQGVAGEVELATVSFYTEIPGRHEIKLDGLQLVDPQGTIMPGEAVGTVIEVVSQ